MICPYCKKEIPDSSMFCDGCGQEVKHNLDNIQEADRFWEKENIEKQKEVSRIREMQAAQKNRKKRQKKTVLATLIGLAVLASIVIYSVVFVPQIRYDNALELLKAGEFEEARGIFVDLGDYKDSDEKIKECDVGITEINYKSAMAAYDLGNYEEALELFLSMEGYQDSASYIERCKENIYSSTYSSAMSLFAAQSYSAALELFISLDGYSDSNIYAKLCQDYIDGIRWDYELDGQIYSATYLDACRIIGAESYQGNEGDSFVDVIGTNQNSKGNRGIDGKTYSHGLEAWIARWNFSSEISWAYAILELGTQYQSLSGYVTLIDSYNTDNFDSTLYFYDGERLIESFTLSPQSIPFEFSIDVTDVTQLKVYVCDNVAVAGGTSFGIVDAVLSAIKPEFFQTSAESAE